MVPPREIEKAVFEAALNISDPNLRRTFVEQACGQDEVLKNRLIDLLKVNEEATLFFGFQPRASGEVENHAATNLETSQHDGVGAISSPALVDENTYIGPYKLLKRIGEGGGGVVYLAEQRKPIHREVALKVIRLGMDTERVIARFELERQALSLMSHPNIAQVLDAGCTPAGRPFFAMELVHGVQITTFCDENRLPLPARLELFVQVCHAIQHAHQRGILHRDIKPSNILVTTHDEVAFPKVIDFGIAKAIEDRLANVNSSTIGGDRFIGTPAYMSPEQASSLGGNVDTRSDIYSLGALLYQLLTGHPPFDFNQSQYLQIEDIRNILNQREVLPPSKRFAALARDAAAGVAWQRNCRPDRLGKLLAGDLDWIVMKSMEKERQQRYATVQDLAADIVRYLRNEAVTASPPSQVYRLRKVIRRNRIFFATCLSVALVLLVGLASSSWLFFRERDARRQQAILLAQAEESGKLTRSAFLVREGKFEEADALLDEFTPSSLRPSLDGLFAFRSVGDWLAMHERWKQACARYSVALQLNYLDISTLVSRDWQAYSILLAQSGKSSDYTRFCHSIAENPANGLNSATASRVLKICLLRPVDSDFMKCLQPLGEISERSHSPRGKSIWAAIPICLWQYRGGKYTNAADSASKAVLTGPDDSAATATMCAIASMALSKIGKTEGAKTQLARAARISEDGFRDQWTREVAAQGYWYDWLYAQELLREAKAIGVAEGFWSEE